MKEKLFYHHQNTEDALELYRLLRKMTHELSQQIPGSYWEHTIKHSEYGTMKMWQWLRYAENHTHILQMQRVYNEWKNKLKCSIMEITKWFDRKFDFHFGMEAFPGLLQRLGKSADKVREIIREIPEQELNYKPGGKWSIKEHIGHLWIQSPMAKKIFGNQRKQNGNVARRPEQYSNR